MQVFEFHFNPGGKPDLIFDSFCYEPENIYERRVGSLYMVGFLKNVLPKNLRFLNNLAKTVKERYYRLTLKNPERALKESLKDANAFLENIAKSGDVSWLGNLSFAALSFSPHQKPLWGVEMNFTKVGDVKIFLLRKGEVIDIDRKLKFQEITPWPLKIFGNIASGKLAENDVILILTKEVSDFFQNQNITGGIARITPFDEKKLKEFFKSKSEALLGLSGVCLLISLKKEIFGKKRETISPQSYPKEFSLKKAFAGFFRQTMGKRVFRPIFNSLKKVRAPKLKISVRLPKPKLPKPKFPKIKLPRLTIPKPKAAVSKPKEVSRSKTLTAKPGRNLILIPVLIFILLSGFLIFQQQEKKTMEAYRSDLNQIQEKVSQAENLLAFKEATPAILHQADSLFKEGWQELSPLIKISPTLSKDLRSEVTSLEDKISKNLYQLNKFTEITEPEPVFEADPQGFIPQKIISFNNELYSFSPYSKNVLKISQSGESQLIPTEKKFNLAGKLEGAYPLSSSVLFFSEPNQLTILNDGGTFESSLEMPDFDFNFDRLSSFRSNLYFLDRASGKIIRYPYLGSFQWGFPQLWSAGKIAKALSITVDGSVWILSEDNKISRYYAGKLQETLKSDFFPFPENLSKIFTSTTLPYLYLLEPAQKRIVIINKSGQIVKQFQSKKFDNLLDFAVSEDGKTIWLLNGLTVYRIKL